MRGGRWLHRERRDEVGKGDAQKSLAKLVSRGALSTRQTLRAVSEPAVYLGTLVTFRRSRFPATVCRENLPGSGDWLWRVLLTGARDFKREREKTAQKCPGEGEDPHSLWCSVMGWGTMFGLQLAFSEAKVLFWGKLTCTFGSFVSSIPEKMNTLTDEVGIRNWPSNSRKRDSNPFHDGFSPAHLAAWGASPRKEHSLSITKDRTWDYVDILLMQNSDYIPIWGM